MPAPVIPTMPDPPARSDSKTQFNNKAFAWVAALGEYTAALNAFGEYLNSYTPPEGGPTFDTMTSTPGGSVTGILYISRILFPSGDGQGFIHGQITVTSIGEGIGAPTTIVTLPEGWRPDVSNGEVLLPCTLNWAEGPGTLTTETSNADLVLRIVDSNGNIQTIGINGSGSLNVNGTWRIPAPIS